ncbi:class I SAM-dependent methyltransferase [Alicyclobacillus acidiphilus]|uniref:class I SAM-dependent methyltransferase n=1 Tax=Alicyclobacillus acidiphilus TaxID=182455 RepID=UPI0008374F3E|nr:class I SAM-dependent methyltransferase [Alicyclobacillus acidiphilus]
MNYHDALSRLGVMNAHPGGADVTLAWMNSITVSPGAKVLDIGCGNGDTACKLAETFDAEVTAVDLHPRMVNNTKRLASARGVRIHGVVGNVEALPLANDTFDLVVAESVLVFTNIQRSIREIRRVVKSSGQVVDVEMMVLEPVTDEWRKEVRSIYGAKEVPDATGWKARWKQGGFRGKVLRSGPLSSLHVDANQRDMGLADDLALSDPNVLRVLERNGRWMQEHGHQMGYVVFLLNPEFGS